MNVLPTLHKTPTNFCKKGNPLSNLKTNFNYLGMIKRILLLLSCVALLAIVYSLYDNVINSSYILQSTTNCCTISVTRGIDNKGDMIYIVEYNTDNIESDIVTCTHDELDATINSYQEYCYHYHQ